MYPDALISSDSDVDAVTSLFSNKPLVKRKVSTELKYECSFPDCGQKFMREVHLDRHEYKHYKVRKHVCTYEGCDKSYTNSTHLKRHINSVHEKKLCVEGKLKCPVDNCKKMFLTIFNMERHMKVCHVDPKMYACPNCSKEFRRKIQLRRHLVTHTGEKPFKCEKCSQGFLYKGLFKKHICNSKSYNCDHCEKNFPRWTQLVMHKREKHNALKCNQCEKTFKRTTFLSAHLETHKNKEDREVLQCPREGCNKFYYSISNLRNHIRITHEGKKHKCPVEGCGKALSQRRKLTLHLKQHETPAKIQKPRKEQKDKNPRKDTGVKKKSHVGALAGVALDLSTEKMILNGQGENIEIQLSEAEISATDEEDRIITKIELRAIN